MGKLPVLRYGRDQHRALLAGIDISTDGFAGTGRRGGLERFFFLGRSRLKQRDTGAAVRLIFIHLVRDHRAGGRHQSQQEIENLFHAKQHLD
jgi:hypothetical protein